MRETLGSVSISTKLERIAKMAKSMPGVPLSTLAHHIDIEWLREAYRRARLRASNVRIENWCAVRTCVCCAWGQPCAACSKNNTTIGHTL